MSSFSLLTAEGGENVVGKVFKKLEEKFKNLFGLVFNNKRRSRLGVRVQEFEGASPRKSPLMTV